MRAFALLAAATLATAPSASAFPWMREAQGAEAMEQFTGGMKRGLEAMARDETLVRQIRDLYAEQKREEAAWHAAGKRDLIGGLLNRTIDAILGPKNGIIAGVVDSLAESVAGSQKFPEDAYPFKAPGKTDQRGPCPGLNTLANHGYLPRNGIVTAGQVIAATSKLFNMGADLAAVLVAGAVALNGDIQTLTFSLGGADARTNSLGKLGGILGTETGLDGHGRVNEGDASATRCDFYKCAGDNHNMQPELFKQMLAQAQKQGGQFNVEAQSLHFHARYEDSISTNPNFYFVPPSALIVMGATYFHTGFFTNGTIGAGGSSNIASISSFVGAHFNQDGSISYVPERIPPQGWYRRATPMFLTEALAGILAIYSNPYPVAFGGNAGRTNGFVPGPGLLPTSAQDVNGLGCFLYNAIYADFFGEFYNIVAGVETLLNKVLGVLNPAFGNFFGCTPNYPDERETNTYAYQYQKNASSLPGAPKKQPCKAGAGSECQTSTNAYPGGADTAPNRWQFKSYADGSKNPKP